MIKHSNLWIRTSLNSCWPRGLVSRQCSKESGEKNPSMGSIPLHRVPAGTEGKWDSYTDGTVDDSQCLKVVEVAHSYQSWIKQPFRVYVSDDDYAASSQWCTVRRCVWFQVKSLSLHFMPDCACLCSPRAAALKNWRKGMTVIMFSETERALGWYLTRGIQARSCRKFAARDILFGAELLHPTLT